MIEYQAKPLLNFVNSLYFAVSNCDHPKTVATMISLSSLGVDIGPLIAAASVLGLAIGFGAQTLVADIISGIFFLVDDAFRKGEYIDPSDSKS